MKIRIVNTAYLVVFVAHHVADERAVFGWVDFDSHTIFIDETLPSYKQRETLWHEIAHCLFEEYKFPVRQSEEATVTWLGKALADFVRSNRSFVREYLT